MTVPEMIDEDGCQILAVGVEAYRHCERKPAYPKGPIRTSPVAFVRERLICALRCLLLVLNSCTLAKLRVQLNYGIAFLGCAMNKGGGMTKSNGLLWMLVCGTALSLSGTAGADSAPDVSPICATSVKKTTDDVLLSRGAFCQQSEPLEYVIRDETSPFDESIRVITGAPVATSGAF